MITIHKYEINIADELSVTLPKDAEILHLGLDPNGDVCIWAKVNTDNPMVELPLLVFGTGHNIPDNAKRHLGSVLQRFFVWHIFYRD